MKLPINPDNITLITEDESYLINTNNNYVQKYYWYPNTIINKMIETYCIQNNLTKKILEIGPGTVPFSLSTNFIGYNENIKECINIDIDKDIFPYQNNIYNFIYCRHVLEDIQNPDFVLKEIIRVSNGHVYIETPSPLIESMKNIDAANLSYKYCGYIHHRYLVWSSIEKNEIYFLPKYSCILDHYFEIDDYKAYNIIKNYPVYWNNYFIFNSANPPKVVMYKNGVNFNIACENKPMCQEYIDLVKRSINESIENTNYFINFLNKN